MEAFEITGGHPLMARFSGSGCLAGAVIAAFAAVESEPVRASAAALTALRHAARRPVSVPKARAPSCLCFSIPSPVFRMDDMTLDITLYGIVDPQIGKGRSLASLARAAAEGGTTIIQYRAKEADTRA